MPFLALILAFTLATSCDGIKLFDVALSPKGRTIASIHSTQLMADDEESFSHEIDEKLKKLNNYNLIAQKNLLIFDESISEKSLEDLYESDPYLHILAVKTQIEEIESEVAEIFLASKLSHTKKHHIMKSRISHFAQNGKMKSLAVNNLSQKLKLETINTPSYWLMKLHTIPIHLFIWLLV